MFFFPYKMEELKKFINIKEHTFDDINNKIKNNSKPKSKKICDFLRKKTFSNNNLDNKNSNKVKGKIEKEAILSIENENYSNNITNKIEKILLSEILSEKEKKRVKKIFADFSNFLISIKQNEKQKKEIGDNKVIKTKRIKLNDVNRFIEFKYKFAKESTVANIKIKMRKYIRILNEEPKLDYRKKIMKPKRELNSFDLNNDELYSIIKYLMEKESHLEILLFYFAYFLGFNYSFISRILITNFDKYFNKLYIKKGAKIIRHSFPPLIINLLFSYFKNSRSYISKYLFNDNNKGKSDKSRVETIKFQIESIFDEIPNIKENKKKFLLSHFSKFRKARILSRNIYILFNPEFVKKLNTINFEKKKFKSDNPSEKSFEFIPLEEKDANIMGLESSILFENNNLEEEYYGDDEDSLRMNFDELLKKYKYEDNKNNYNLKINTNENDNSRFNYNAKNKKYFLLSSISSLSNK